MVFLFDKLILVDSNYIQSYCNNHKYWDRQAWANSVDPNQTSQIVASDQGLQYLPLVHINKVVE